MSVIESNRTKTVLATSVKARELASYTIKITTNTKVFLPEYRSSLTDQIVSDAVNIYRFVWLANNIRVGNDPDMWARRSRLQVEARELCNDLLALMGIAKPLFHLRTKRIEYWTGLVIETRTMIAAWHEADTSRYKELGM